MPSEPWVTDSLLQPLADLAAAEDHLAQQRRTATHDASFTSNCALSHAVRMMSVG